ncbi:hypothetical protein RYX36_017097 [Vicia faba]
MAEQKNMPNALRDKVKDVAELIKIVQQIAILIGCVGLPHLRSLVEIIEHGISDENQKVRMITALSLVALTEAVAPYGIESFDPC